MRREGVMYIWLFIPLSCSRFLRTKHSRFRDKSFRASISLRFTNLDVVCWAWCAWRMMQLLMYYRCSSAAVILFFATKRALLKIGMNKKIALVTPVSPFLGKKSSTKFTSFLLSCSYPHIPSPCHVVYIILRHRHSASWAVNRKRVLKRTSLLIVWFNDRQDESGYRQHRRQER